MSVFLSGLASRNGRKPLNGRASLMNGAARPETEDFTPAERSLVDVLEIVLKICDVDMKANYESLGAHPHHHRRICDLLNRKFGTHLKPPDLKGSVRCIALELEKKVIERVAGLSLESVDYLWEKASSFDLVVQKDSGFQLRHGEAPLWALAPSLIILNGISLENNRRDEAFVEQAGFKLI